MKSLVDFDRFSDQRVRTAAFEWLTEQVSIHDDVLPRDVLAEGFQLDGHRVPLIGPQGIFKPAAMQLPLSITTSPKGPYTDHIDSDGLLNYSYRGIDPNHRENVGLRVAMENHLPLVYLLGLVPGRYHPLWPAYVIGDSPELLTFAVSIEHVTQAAPDIGSGENERRIAEVPREYSVSLTRTRVHQRAFRELVLRAYRNQCALCRLRHTELLDAAHIMPDAEPEGDPKVSNGLALCRLHHAAFDKYFVAVRPDHIIEVRPDVLKESDVPTLQHAIQGLHGQHIVLPSRLDERPSIEFLDRRYERFREVVHSL